MATLATGSSRPRGRARDSDSMESDAAARGTYYFLDVGGLKYGECTLVKFGRVRILIDGSHPEDYRGQQGYDSLPNQLDAILGGNRPHSIDLVVVTHCHNDHVGCLPALVENGVIKADFALLTDPKLGFGRASDEDAPTADAMRPADVLAALLREEDASDLNDEELEAFIADAASVEQRYAQFIDGLKQAGTNIIYYRGEPLSGALADRLKPTRAELLGPSLEQLVFCAEQIATTNDEADRLAQDNAIDSTGSLIALYRSVLVEDDRGGIRNPRGNGMNCQSITFAFGPPGARVLLAGDMQFADPGVRGAAEEVKKLRRRVAAAGPFKVFKTTHHTSHNGLDEALLDELGRPPILIHSGGLRDETHPYPETLEMLEDEAGILFARTDRNGLITVKPHLAVPQAISISRGRLNDFTPNELPDAPGPAAAEPAVVLPTARAGKGPQIVIVNLPDGPIDMTVGGVDIRVRAAGAGPALGTGQARIGPDPARLGEGAGEARAPQDQGRFGSIVFATDLTRLSANIGRAEASGAIETLSRSGVELIEGPAAGLLDRVRMRLQADDVRGVILLGGYDVVPSRRFDAIGNTLRQRLGSNARADGDDFIVWSDAAYADKDDDGIAELPVSRVPDGRDARLFQNALAAAEFQARQRFGIRNVARPFAESIFAGMNGNGAIGVSEPWVSKDVRTPELAADCHYFMLHGAEEDGRHFTGEYEDGSGYPTAFEVRLVPSRFRGVVFTGCCWGALIVDTKASIGSGLPPPRVAEGSIALAYLKAGANAFVGCTGSHYSGPSTDPDVNYAAKLHAAFWSGLVRDGLRPAEALHRAKDHYMRDLLGNGRLNPLDTARRLKNFSQFTCLGLGW